MVEENLRIHTFTEIPSPEIFSSQIESKNVPAVFKGCIKDWKAFSKWNPSDGGLIYLQGCMLHIPEKRNWLAGKRYLQLKNYVGDLGWHVVISTQSELKDWSKTNFGEMTNKKNSFLEELAGIDLTMESRDLCAEEMMVRATIVVELENMAKNEEAKWR
ncbi:hypothetical protein RDI58_022765 [Solanum bulbocastanum]|uniref:Uncharacterized protein n=1 Tax=Solanum bulbocastanum TaxID=147425 RepID=A0AAN8Y6G1_SOLBU